MVLTVIFSPPALQSIISIIANVNRDDPSFSTPSVFFYSKNSCAIDFGFLLYYFRNNLHFELIKSVKQNHLKCTSMSTKIMAPLLYKTKNCLSTTIRFKSTSKKSCSCYFISFIIIAI